MILNSYPCEDCSQIVYVPFLMRGCLPRCEACDKANPREIFAPMVVLPAHCTYNGVRKVVGSHKRKEESKVPINIIDEKPGGGYTVTRIGTKGDIDGD